MNINKISRPQQTMSDSDFDSDDEFDELIADYKRLAERAAELEDLNQKPIQFTKVELFRAHGGQGKWPKKPRATVDASLILENRTRTRTKTRKSS